MTLVEANGTTQLRQRELLAGEGTRRRRLLEGTRIKRSPPTRIKMATFVGDANKTIATELLLPFSLFGEDVKRTSKQTADQYRGYIFLYFVTRIVLANIMSKLIYRASLYQSVFTAGGLAKLNRMKGWWSLPSPLRPHHDNPARPSRGEPSNASFMRRRAAC
ncbi:hypothetical protein EVAR_96808_1 [Eumeta japonica]|uniref:Uncharacterized protein n=1 Tax=Eumeta variegata TaxID=151549 RepID=A0A4C1WCL2_EUMVA|nr:hypothetical protein EVAR_96808_1 [Eumeta japonica]